MTRNEITNIIGSEYLTRNLEADEFSYKEALEHKGYEWNKIKIKSSFDEKRYYKDLDIRLVKDGISILVETKKDFNKNIDAAKEQLIAYGEYEKMLTGNKIISILANTDNDKILVYRGAISEDTLMSKETKIKSFEEYAEFYAQKINDKEKVMKNTYNLNSELNQYGIPEKIRSQFVGTCLLALKNGLKYNDPDLTTSQLIVKIKDILANLLDTKDLNKAKKLSLLDEKVLRNQNVRNLEIGSFRRILTMIDDGIFKYINDKTSAGQDILNLFFTTFNKYVGKDDKNQAFTPDHITDFMAKVVGVNRHTTVLDPCCGSGSFLVRAMTQAMDDCCTKEQLSEVKKSHIYGIEFAEDVFGLATTNMLIHSDGNSNVINGSCFDFKNWIQEAKPDIILMNPPYNANKSQVPKEFASVWNKKTSQDPTKGLYFVKYVCDLLNEVHQEATIAVLLPVACAIGNKNYKELANVRTELLEENTLDAVFSLPIDLFYPGANAVVCCMIIKVGTKHNDKSNPKTFFGYYKDDGFKKKKNLGRIEQTDKNGHSLWAEIEDKWISLYKNRVAEAGISATKEVTADDEWLCEAYMETDYSQLQKSDFVKTINNYYSFVIKENILCLEREFMEEYIHNLPFMTGLNDAVNTKNWKSFIIKNVFKKEKIAKFSKIPEEIGEIPFISSTSLNNGVSIFCDEKAINGNCITVSTNGDGFNCFYQPTSIVVSNDVEVLYSNNINPITAMFLCTILNQESFKWCFGRKPKNNKVFETEIKLPVKTDANGDIIIDETYKYSENGYIPDWDFMSEYIKSLSHNDKTCNKDN